MHHCRSCEQKNQSNEDRPISCPETSEMCSNMNSSSKKTERILKIIEENSKILDRIMSKNAKSTIMDSVATISDASGGFESRNTGDELFETMHASIESVENVGDVLKSADKAPESKETKPEELLRRDVNDFLTDFLKKFDENVRNEECILSIDAQEMENPSVAQSTVLTEYDTGMSHVFDDVTSESVPETVEEIIKQAMEKSSPILATTILDPNIENDLQSLLKMSAELLRDELPTISSVVETNTENLPDVSASDILSNVFLEFDGCEAVAIKGTGDDPITDVEAENTTGDISATISSIKNTIKSIDDLCQDDDRRSRERTDKTLNDIIKVVEKLEDDTRQKKHIEKADDNIPMTTVESIVEHIPRRGATEVIQSLACDENDVPAVNSRLLSTTRMSRDRSRITSPRHRKHDDFGEFESRTRRSKSPVLLISTDVDNDGHPINSNRYSDDNTTKYSLDAFKLQRISDDGVVAKTSSLHKSNEKLEIRHTTVTSTFYDRFLSQKLEQQHKMDRSPSSPMITNAYLDTLKPISFMSSSYPSSDSKNERRGSKSNENSPVRSNNDVSLTAGSTIPPRSSFLLMPHLSYNTIDRTSTYTRSCDNIPSNLNTTRSKHISPLFGPPDCGTDYNFKRHSTVGAYSNAAPLPIKPKKPSELGIKLGLYKPSS